MIAGEIRSPDSRSSAEGRGWTRDRTSIFLTPIRPGKSGKIKTVPPRVLPRLLIGSLVADFTRARPKINRRDDNAGDPKTLCLPPSLPLPPPSLPRRDINQRI